MNAPKLPSDVESTIKPKKEIEKKSNMGPDDPLDKKRWENRRRMAWSSLLMMIALTATLVIVALFTNFDMKRLDPIAEVLSMSYLGFTSVIGAYMGFTTWASKGRR